MKLIFVYAGFDAEPLGVEVAGFSAENWSVRDVRVEVASTSGARGFARLQPSQKTVGIVGLSGMWALMGLPSFKAFCLSMWCFHDSRKTPEP